MTWSLPALTAGVRCDQGFDDVERLTSFAQQLQAIDPVVRIDQRLGRDTANAGSDMRHASADREEARRNGYSELPG